MIASQKSVYGELDTLLAYKKSVYGGVIAPPYTLYFKCVRYTLSTLYTHFLGES
jgi:hypothetical protein